MHINDIINLKQHPIDSHAYRSKARQQLNQSGAYKMTNFLQKQAITKIINEATKKQHQAYYCKDSHNVYLTPTNNEYPPNHPINRQITSSKGCIADDTISIQSPLRTLYNDPQFKDFLQFILNEEKLYPYADKLSSLNIHYADDKQELGWHFDNSSFAITLLLQKPNKGGKFQYVKDLRNAEQNNMNFNRVNNLLDGKMPYQEINMNEGTLLIFRGRNSIHRVTPTIGNKTRILAVLAYNNKDNVKLSETALKTFYGRIN